MPDKSQATPGGLFALSHHRLIAITGSDATAFAQAHFMNDVTLLADAQWQWNGWLTPKGRVIALFALLRLDGETLWLVLPDADPGQVASALRRFVFRSKVAITVRDDVHVAGRFGAPVAASGAMASVSIGKHARDAVGGTPDSTPEVELDMSAENSRRTLHVLVSPSPAETAQEAEWAAQDLRHGLPRLPASQMEHWTPQQLSLDRLKAFSVKKGCYPGQEIVARTHFLGKVKRGLMLLAGSVPLEAGSELQAAGGTLGTVVSTAAGETGPMALAVVPLEREAGMVLTVNDAPVTELPLLGGLAR